MIDRAAITLRRPGQRIARHCRGKRKAVADARFDLASFLVVVPSHQLQAGQLCPGVVEAVDFGKCVQPRLGALLAHDAARSPGCQRVVESLVGRADCLFIRERHPHVVKTREIAAAVVGCRRHDPGIASSAQGVGEASVVLKNKKRLRGQLGVHCVPVDRIGKINVEVRHHGPPLHGHVRR